MIKEHNNEKILTHMYKLGDKLYHRYNEYDNFIITSVTNLGYYINVGTQKHIWVYKEKNHPTLSDSEYTHVDELFFTNVELRKMKLEKLNNNDN
jgi:hypothetical protein